MIKKITFFVACITAFTFAVPTVIDTVKVPIKLLNCVSKTGDGATAVYDFAGKVAYDLAIGDNDSLSTKLEFVPVGGGATITPYEVTGDVGIRSLVNGINGQNNIYFKCKVTGQPAAQYTAKITIEATTSRVERITDSLVGLMTLAEKISLLHADPNLLRSSADISRLGIPGWYMSNGPSSVCWGASGTSTAFPTGISMANTFDTTLMYKVGIALAKEYYSKGKFIIEAPAINLIRDPRSGRGWEGFGEDPYLAGQISIAYTEGAQSLKCAVMPKHFVCNDREDNRKTSSATISDRTLREIYAMPFEYSFRDGKAWSIMSGHNSINGVRCSQSAPVLTGMLKDGWGFRGFVMSDYNSIYNTIPAANAGQDAEIPGDTRFGQPLLDAANAGSVSAARINDMVQRVLRVTVWAGLIGKVGPSAVTKYTSDLKSAAHKQLALDVAHEGIVLLKNDKFGTETAPVLPLDKTTIKSVALVGVDAYKARFEGGTSSSGRNCPDDVSNTFRQGIIDKIGASKVLDSAQWKNADVVIACVGVQGEGEGTDRLTLGLDPASQNTMINSIIAAGKKCVVVLTGGSPPIKDSWSNAPSILTAWYPGVKQGAALADIVFGDVNPSGRLSETFPVSASQLPTWQTGTFTTIVYESPDTGRGYRYFDRCNIKPLYSFGYGLSYTTFQYGNLKIPTTSFAGENVVVSVDIKNIGTVAGDEVAQLYITEKSPKLPRPVKELRGFTRVTLAAGETKTVSFTLREREFAYWDPSASKFVVQPDDYTIKVGPSSDNLPLTGTVTLQSPW